MSNHTDNIVVEVEMYSRPSALSVTKAKYWVFVDGYRFIWIKPIEIYRFIEQNNYIRTVFTGDGDDVKKKAYLINKTKFVLWVYQLDKESGWVDMIKENNPIHYNNFKDTKK